MSIIVFGPAVSANEDEAKLICEENKVTHYKTNDHGKREIEREAYEDSIVALGDLDFSSGKIYKRNGNKYCIDSRDLAEWLNRRNSHGKFMNRDPEKNTFFTQDERTEIFALAGVIDDWTLAPYNSNPEYLPFSREDEDTDVGEDDEDDFFEPEEDDVEDDEDVEDVEEEDEEEEESVIPPLLERHIMQNLTLLALFTITEFDSAWWLFGNNINLPMQCINLAVEHNSYDVLKMLLTLFKPYAEREPRVPRSYPFYQQMRQLAPRTVQMILHDEFGVNDRWLEHLGTMIIATSHTGHGGGVHPRALESLLSSGAIDARGSSQGPPWYNNIFLDTAGRFGNIEAMQYLIDDISNKPESYTSLYVFVYGEWQWNFRPWSAPLVPTASYVPTNPIAPKSRAQYFLCAPLNTAIISGHSRAVRYLLDNGANCCLTTMPAIAPQSTERIRDSIRTMLETWTANHEAYYSWKGTDDIVYGGTLREYNAAFGEGKVQIGTNRLYSFVRKVPV